ncbi:MAG: GNAT family N-acetyltransferase [Planctomycetales bacterium]|nr:GNAT family N-acetyltransferase [Planctomycetales bacterium]
MAELLQQLNCRTSSNGSTTLVTDSDAWDALAVDWDRLAGDVAFRQFAWCRAWWNAYANERRQLAIMVCRDESARIVGIAPFVREASWQRGVALCLLGGGEACGDRLSLLVEPGCESQVVAALCEALHAWRDAWGWDCIYLDGVEADDPLTAALADRMAQSGAHLASRNDAARWAFPLPDTYEGYVAGLGKRMRRFVRQTQRDLERSDYGLEVRRPSSPHETSAMFAQLVELHGMRWQEDDQSGAFASPYFKKFLSEVAQSWFANGSLRLFVLSLDGEPAAAAIGVRTGEVFSAFLLGRNPKFDDVRPGWMLNLAMIASAIDEGANQFDFLRGDEEYKARLGAQPVAQRRLTITAPGPVNGVRVLAGAGRVVAKRTRDRLRNHASQSLLLKAATRFALAT